jgi:dihydroorotate dehydrogenase electron transfer subunit
MDVSKKNTIPVSLPIREIVEETPIIKTFKFDYSLGSKPGQFVMMWIHGVDQKPMSVAYDDGKEFWLTVQKVGPATEAAFDLKEGDLVGISGPFGTNFMIGENEHVAVVGGGCGCVPIYFATIEALKKGCTVDYIVSASSEEKLLFTDRLEKTSGVNLHVCEIGVRGQSTEILKKVIEENKIDKIFTCSHELAMKEVSDAADDAGIFCQLSMERYMKCGFGVCGQCTLDPLGICVCKQGPVMNNALLKKVTEFGKYHRDSQGQKNFF